MKKYHVTIPINIELEILLDENTWIAPLNRVDSITKELLDRIISNINITNEITNIIKTDYSGITVDEVKEVKLENNNIIKKGKKIWLI